MKIYDNILKEELERLTPVDRAESELTDAIASRIESVMKRKGISKSELARLTGKRPCEVTKWLGGGHNFTCRTIALIETALGTDIVKVVGRRSTY